MLEKTFFDDLFLSAFDFCFLYLSLLFASFFITVLLGTK